MNDLLELAGIALVVVAAALVAQWLGCLFGGVALIAIANVRALRAARTTKAEKS